MNTAHIAKTGLKRAIKRAAAAGGALTRHETGSRILTYHSVGQRDHEMNVSPAAFEEQMRWLAGHTRVIPLSEAAAGAPGVAITFDDGYADNLRHAAPVLNALALPATVFVVAERAGAWLPHDAETPAARLLTWDETRELHARGIEIGAHGMRHRRLARLDTETQRFEIVESKRLIEAQTGAPVAAFAYPYGSALDYDATSVRLVQQANYAYAVSNRYGPNAPDTDRHTLRRVWVDRSDTPAMFRAKVTGRLDVLRALDSRVGIRLRRGANALLGTR